MKRYWRIYMYTFPNDKKYIGATVRTLVARQGKDWQRYKGCKQLWNAIQKYGINAIKQEILVEGEMDPEEAADLEQHYIEQYNTTDPEYGYNKTPGGEGLKDRNISENRREELKQQMREIAKRNKGRVVSEETREKQRNAKLGKKRGAMNQETKKKISEANSLKNISDETRKKKSKGHQKKVIVTDSKTGKSMVFNSIEETASYYGVQSSTVSRWIAGKRKPKNKNIYQFYSPTTTE